MPFNKWGLVLFYIQLWFFPRLFVLFISRLNPLICATHTHTSLRCCFIYFRTYGFSKIHTIYSSFHGPIAAHSKLQVLYSPWDYRSEGASGSEWKEVTVRSSTEVLFQPDNSTKVRKFKLSSVVSLTLSA